ncbi:MAG: hypothetical protein WD876_00620 [Candidatus Pacearchaeota archaeon]
MKLTKHVWYKIVITMIVFWLADFVMHITGVGESNYYYVLKLMNSFLLAFIWFTAFDERHKQVWKRGLYAVIAGTWISFTYLMTSYSGLVQWLGFEAYYAPPPFVIFGLFLPPFFWWIYHLLVFWAGLELAKVLIKK